MKLTSTQRHWLEQARISSDRQEYLSIGARSGGSVNRMLKELERRGLLDGPPWYITPAGRAALDAAQYRKAVHDTNRMNDKGKIPPTEEAGGRT